MAEVIRIRPIEPSRGGAILAALLALILACGAAFAWPEAPGTLVQSGGGACVDSSNARDGYLCVKHDSSDQKFKLRISKGDMAYTYDLAADGAYEVFPLQMGSGSYQVAVYRQVKGTQYVQVFTCTVRVELVSENAAFLCPSQYVWYTADSQAVQKAEEVCADLDSARDEADAVYRYIVDHFIYNYMRALTVGSGYVPDIDQVLSEKMGICFDFAALMACMLRVEDIPTRVVIGYADDNYHAWDEVLLGGDWVRYDPTAEITNTNVETYTAERYY